MDHMSRRALFAGVLAAVAGVAARAVPGNADTGDPVVLGESNYTTMNTSIHAQGARALTLHGGLYASDYSAVVGDAENWSNDFSVGVRGLGHTGVHGVGTIGVDAEGDTIGVAAGGDRGGVFLGSLAQVRLIPSARPTHPVSGLRGDLFMDRRDRLWLCRGQNDWVRLA